jgi:hypothetical protein
MISSSANSRDLLLRLAFFTTKSRRQTTPNLFQNPKLTERGIITKQPKSYAYNVPQTVPNHHLYWNHTLQNKIRRTEYNAHRLYKLGIKPIHDAQGKPLNNRTIEEILYELSNLRLLKESLGRTLANLREIATRFPEVTKGQDLSIVHWALDQLEARNISSMTPYEFSSYLFLRDILKAKSTPTLLVHMYKWIEGEVERPSDRFKIQYFLSNMRYVFSEAYPVEYNDILYKKQVEFKLFEDIEPTNKPLEEILPRLFSDAQLQELKTAEKFKLENYKFLLRIPGGKGLFDRLEKA